MKYSLIIMALTATVLASSCSGKKADQENADSLYQYTDTNASTIDTTTMDSVHAKKLADTTMNAPKMPGGK